MQPACLTCTSLALAASIAAGAQATTLLVPREFPTIQAAINAARNGDVVEIADGVYGGAGNTDLNTLGKAITVRSALGAEHCIIDAAFEARVLTMNSGEGASTVIEGLT